MKYFIKPRINFFKHFFFIKNPTQILHYSEMTAEHMLFHAYFSQVMIITDISSQIDSSHRSDHYSVLININSDTLFTGTAHSRKHQIRYKATHSSYTSTSTVNILLFWSVINKINSYIFTLGTWSDQKLNL